jgi:hypothetical protein
MEDSHSNYPETRKSPVSTYAGELRELRKKVFELEEKGLWETIQAKDVPPEIVDFVRTQVMKRQHADDIRMALQITSPNAAPWRKIMAAFKHGNQVGVGASVAGMIHKHWEIGQKLEAMIADACDNGTPAVDENGRFLIDGKGEPVRVTGPNKDLAQFIDVWGRNNERYVALAVKAGLMKDPAQQLAGGKVPTTIQVTTNVVLPTEAEIQAKQAEMKARAQAITVQSKRVSVDEAE